LLEKSKLGEITLAYMDEAGFAQAQPFWPRKIVGRSKRGGMKGLAKRSLGWYVTGYEAITYRHRRPLHMEAYTNETVF
jgi:hypothetical protein